ncbi:MAG: DEAD/DEAH box helicase family protein [Neisseriaceae bacterium]|nr:DEAD/DEAH box helicase family protein [Neisseriaceae bacterium]
MNEEDIKLKFITPALQKAGWNIDNQINMEFPVRKDYLFTDGRILFKENKVERGERKRADYLLSYQNGFPLGIVEAKDSNHALGDGLQQAQDYAKMLGVFFVYSSNGKGFLEYDFFTGRTTELALDNFPSPQQLFERFRQGKGISNPEQIDLITTPFDTYRKTPRYYQINAVNRTIEAVARNQKRILLVMATGTGKTFTASQIAHRLLQSKKAKHILYLADRNSLIDQTIKGDFKHFKGITRIESKSFDPAFQIHFGLYHQFVDIKGKDEIDDYLAKNPDKKHLVREEIIDKESGEKEYIIEHFKEFAPDFFDTIFVDECHRSSRRANSQWRKILEYYANAVQIGMTATPKDPKNHAENSNLTYFGEPVYTYSLKQGIDDGFLAPYKVIRYGTNIDNFGYRPEQGKTDKYGNLVEDKIYTTSDFDNRIIIDERSQIIAKTISDFLKNRLDDRFARTIVFCEDQTAAAVMRDCLSNENSDLQAEYNGEYVVRITNDEHNKEENLEKFNSTAERNLMPIIATTSDLMRTGVDSKLVKVIVFNCSVGSISEFKQMIGRGTRIDEDNGKTYFTILDFKNVTHYFSDPEFDGPVDNSNDFPKQKRPPNLPPSQRKINVNGVEVTMDSEMEQILDASGKLISTNFTDYTRTNLLGEYANLKDFLAAWNSNQNKGEFLQLLESKGILIEEIKNYDQFRNMDEFDILISLAYGANALSRTQRAKKAGKILDKFTGQAREVLQKLIDKYEQNGIDELEDLSHTLQNPPFNFMDISFNLNQIFSTNNDNGFDIFLNTIDEIKTAIYENELEAA